MWDKPVDDETAAALEALGLQVRCARRHAALSHGAVEAMTGVDQTTIVRLEHGRATGLPLRRFAILLAALDAGVATRRPAVAFGLAAPGSYEWINGGPAWDTAVDGEGLSDGDEL